PLVPIGLQQNGVVERRNHTLIEAACTMLIYAQAPLFLWAEAMETACFTQNRSIIRLRHGKTPYELMHDKQPIVRMSSSLGPALNEMTPRTISSGLVQKSSSSTSYVPPSRNDWDLLFQPLFDELLNPPPSVDNQAAEVIAPIAEVIPQVDDDSTGLPSSTTVDQNAPSPSKSPTPTEIQSSVILQDVGNDNLDIEVEHMGNDPLLGVPITEVISGQSSSTASPQSNVQPNYPITHHNSKWTKDHPQNYIIGPLSRPVSTRLQLHEQALFCYYDAFLTLVWELVPRPDKVMVITLKWIYKVKLDELGGILKNKACLVTRGYRQEEGIDFEESFAKKAFRIYNRRTRRIVETIHVDFDELTAMASVQSSSGPALQEMTPATISSGLVHKPSSSTSYVPPTRNDWDLLFQPLFDELLNPPPSVDNQDAEVIAPIAEVIPQVDDDSTGSPSLTEVDQDAHSPKALTQACWIEAMQEELHEFERLEVWDLVP
nr:hypothetical protein [Tanacetum cinerariifolium]